MKVLFLPMYDNQLSHYSDNPKETIDWLLRYDSHLVMEPGELADYARGAIFLLNSEAKVTIHQHGDRLIVPEGESVFLFFEDTKRIHLSTGTQLGFRKGLSDRVILQSP